jgi:prepilin-type N-terminal cleavage/methylation domain-containing protein
MRRSGFTLLELLIAAVIFSLIGFAVSRAYAVGIQFEVNSPKTREALEKRIAFEEQVANLLRSAYLSPTATDTVTCFIASTGNGTTSTTTTTLTQNSNAGGGSTLATSNFPNTLVFTTQGQRLPGSFLSTQETDLQTINDKYGPIGGITEVGISTTAVGDAGDMQGLFLRQQSPADTDHTQGGIEQLLSADIANIGFEFFDGTNWGSTWDTTQPGQRRLPAAVRVTYTLNGDENTDHVFTVQLPLSDVTPDNPANVGSTIGGTTTGGGG